MACLVASPLKINLNKMAHAKKKSIVIEIPNEKAKKKATNLQEAFERFRKGRQQEIKMAKVMEERALSLKQDQIKMDILRAKFLDGVKKYFGVPYAKRYHDENSPYHNAPLFLDCCGLVRRVLLDLKDDFGFKVGGGNQAYQFDTLPIDIKEEEMKPGDLVFISATYYEKPGKKWKKQRHDMVHVEVWAGDGEKTIGARWQKGVVQVFDSYKFVSKSYYNMKFHFKSIDTWLMGICKSFCPEHAWRSSKYDPGKKSIFSEKEVEEDDESQAAEQEEDDNVQQQQQNRKSNENFDENVCKKQEISNAEKLDGGQKAEQDENVEENVSYKNESCEVLVETKNTKLSENEINSNALIVKEDTFIELGQQENGVKLEEILKSEETCRGNTIKVAQRTEEKDIETFNDNNAENEQTNKEETKESDEIEKVENLGKISKETIKTIVQNVQNRQKMLENEIQASTNANQELQTACIDDNQFAQTQDKNHHLQTKFLDASDFVLTNCNCPECLPSDQNCIHTTEDSCYENPSEFDEDCLSRNKEITTSLECFEVIGSPECRQEVEESISCCPTGKSGQGSSSGGNSPENDEKPSRDFNGSPKKNNDSKKTNNNSNRPSRNGAQSRMRHNGRQPTFYVSPGNGSSMVAATLESLGWRKIEDRYDESFKLKWVECKSQIDYQNFRDGDQLVNHISNIGLLTTKLGLLCSLEEYERVLDKVGSKQRIQLSDFVPETVKLTNLTEKQKFLNEVYKEGEVWICKPIGQNQGKGIYMINSSAQLRDRLKLNGESDEATNGRRNSRVRPPAGRIIQRYIANPLLLNGFKFDVRAYMFIASTNPYIVLYHPGYIRLSCVPYSPFSEEASSSILTAHLTNQFIQKKHPLYSSMKDETVWSYERMQSYIDEHHTKEKGLADNWMFTTFTKRMQQIMLTCFHSVRKKLHRRTGFFDLLGFDFMIDENFKVWLIEVNVNPSLSTSCKVLKEVIPDMVDSTVKVAIEIFDKTKKRRPVFPLENINGFTVLYNGEGKS